MDSQFSKSNGQGSLEYLLLTGAAVLIAVIIFLIIFQSTKTGEGIIDNQLDDYSDSFPDTVYLFSSPSEIVDYLSLLPQKSDHKIISGQFLGHTAKIDLVQLEGLFQTYGNYYGPELNELHDETGEWPALIGGDYYPFNPAASADYSVTNKIFGEYWKEGGWVMLSLHMPNPQTGGTSEDTTILFSELSNPASSSHAMYMIQLDIIAEGLSELQEQGVIVWIRPLHEMNGDWFWWGNQNPGEFIQLWREMHNYFVDTKGLNNLVWVYAPNANEGEYVSYYPGDAYVDVVGLDYYGNNPSSMDIQGYTELIALNKPFGFTEFGPYSAQEPIPTDYDYTQFLSSIQSDFPEAVFWQSWHGDWGMHAQQNADDLLQNEAVINRGEWK